MNRSRIGMSIGPTLGLQRFQRGTGRGQILGLGVGSDLPVESHQLLPDHGHELLVAAPQNSPSLWLLHGQARRKEG